MHRCTERYISTENNCTKLTVSSATEETQLSSNQEDADTTMLLHCKHAHERFLQKAVIVRLHSADIDILVMLLGRSESQQIYLDSGTGLHRKGVNFNYIEMSTERKNCLTGAFKLLPEMVKVPCFSEKGRAAC